MSDKLLDASRSKTLRRRCGLVSPKCTSNPQFGTPTILQAMASSITKVSRHATAGQRATSLAELYLWVAMRKGHRVRGVTAVKILIGQSWTTASFAHEINFII